MPKFSSDRVVNHSAERMLDLVADVEKYPQFVPLCAALVVREREDGEARSELVTDMTIAYKVFRESFTTKVTIDRDARSVEANYLDGPFHHLDTIWRFEDLGENKSRVHFDIDYQFKSPILAGLMGAGFSKAFDSFSEAFERRADELYGADQVNAG